MSTETEPARTKSWLQRAHAILDVPFLFDLNQVILDGGKRAPVNKFLQDVAYETILDLGCGTGAWSYLTREKYVGLDYSRPFIEGCRRQFGSDPRKSFMVGDVETLESQMSFDLALMMSVLHHLSDDQANALMERLSRVATRLLVMDLIPIEYNPLSKFLYNIDRGDHIRTTDEQRRVLIANGRWLVQKEGSFYSYNRLYRHTLFLLKTSDSAASASQTDRQQ